MWKYLLALVVLFAFGGLAAAEIGQTCIDCYANSVVQDDTQTVTSASLGSSSMFPSWDKDSAVGNEALSAGVIVTNPMTQPTPGATFIQASFGRIEQTMSQTVSGVTGAKGITENKAIQAAWVQGQGRKEVEKEDGCWYPATTTEKEGALAYQKTTQNINTITSYDCQDDARVFNADNKLAMIVDDINRVINIAGTANSNTADGASSSGTITNNVDINVA